MSPSPALVSVLVPTPPVRGLGGVYTYAVPDDLSLAPGDYVDIGFAGQKLVGVVWDTAPDTKVPKGKLKPVVAKLDIPRLPAIDRQFVEWLADYTLSPIGAVLRMVLAGTGALQRPMKRPQRAKPPETTLPPKIMPLSEAQRAAANQLIAAVEANDYTAILLDGVTGAGKTEVYADAIAAALDAGKQVLVMLPEIALTGQLLERFAARFGFFPTEWHSELTPAQRRRHWHAIARGEAKLIVGARSSLLLPYARLGLIVVDEEHEAVYKQEDGVIYHARDMAVVRARLGKLPVILSTATPALESWTNVQLHRYARVELPGRFADAELPDLKLIDLRIDKPPKINGSPSWLSPTLVAAMRERLERGEQSLLFLNRRGYAPLTLCRACGFRFQCPQCSAWMVSHGSRNGQRLLCHHCGYGQSLPDACPSCHVPDQFAACGPGVERIAEEVQALFPQARSATLTSDFPEQPGEVRALIDDMAAGKIDILVGTQMVTKGHHFPNLTLVGVIDADLGLGGGDLRAAERTYQTLTQVAGRAGRATKKGQVLIQTVDPAQPLMQALSFGTTLGARDMFLAAQLRERQLFRMPPAGRLAALILSGVDRGQVEQVAKELAINAPRDVKDVQILGPAPAPLALLRGRHRIRFLLKAGRDVKVQPMIQKWLEQVMIPKTVQATVDIDPYSFM